MAQPQTRYRLYIDESGDHVFHDEDSLAETGHRYLAVVGCWIAVAAYLPFHRALEEFKHKHLPHSPDEPLILHRRDIVNCSGPFWRLQDDRARGAFNTDLLELIRSTDFKVVGVVIDKMEMKTHFPDPFHPYHIALRVLLERYCNRLLYINRMGDVLGESRGTTEDWLLRSVYDQIYTYGTVTHRHEFFQRTLTSRELKLKKKSANASGLQLADLLAHPVRNDILSDHGRPCSARGDFGTRVIDVISSKYEAHPYDETVAGWGKVLLPNPKKGPPHDPP